MMDMFKVMVGTAVEVALQPGGISSFVMCERAIDQRLRRLLRRRSIALSRTTTNGFTPGSTTVAAPVTIGLDVSM